MGVVWIAEPPPPSLSPLSVLSLSCPTTKIHDSLYPTFPWHFTARSFKPSPNPVTVWGVVVHSVIIARNTTPPWIFFRSTISLTTICSPSFTHPFTHFVSLITCMRAIGASRDNKWSSHQWDYCVAFFVFVFLWYHASLFLCKVLYFILNATEMFVQLFNHFFFLWQIISTIHTTMTFKLFNYSGENANGTLQEEAWQFPTMGQRAVQGHVYNRKIWLGSMSCGLCGHTLYSIIIIVYISSGGQLPPSPLLPLLNTALLVLLTVEPPIKGTLPSKGQLLYPPFKSANNIF